MANGKISIVDSANAKKELDILYAELDRLEKKILGLSGAVQTFSTSLASVKSVTDLATRLQALEQSQTKVNQKMTEAEKLAARRIVLEEKLVAAESELGREVSRLSKEYTNLISQQKTVVKSTAQLAKEKKTEASAYLQLQSKLTALKKEYRDLAVLQAQDIKLSAQQSVRLKTLTKDITTYDGQLKKVDAGMGVYSRSVGSYGKQFDSLGFSVAQLTRESPAFINSMQTGFMAISNNIPIFVDEINKLKKANVALADKGLKQVNVWKKLGAAIFGWQSLISAAIVLLTLFGPKLVKMAKEAIQGAGGIDTLSDSIKGLDDATKDSIGEMISLIAVVQDVTSSEEERLGAIKKLNDEYPELIANITDETDETKDLNKQVEGYIELVIRRARAKKLEGEIGEKALDLYEKTEERKKQENKLSQEQINLYNKAQQFRRDNIKDGKISNEVQRKYNLMLVGSGKELIEYTHLLHEESIAKEAMKELTEDLLTVRDKEDKLVKGSVEYLQDLIDTNNEYIKAKLTVGDLDEARVLQEENKEWQRQIDLILNRTKAGRKDKKERDEAFKGIASGMTDLTGSLIWIDTAISQLDDFYKAATNQDERDALLKRKIELQELRKVMSELADEAGLAGTRLQQNQITFSDTFMSFAEGTLAVQDFVDEYGEQIDQAINATNMFFDNRIERLQQDRDANEEYFDNLINLASGNDEEQASLEEQKEARDKELREKQNKAAKKQAIFNRSIATFDIILNTAVGITKAIAQTGFPLALPFVIASSVLGAAQIAAVASAPLPKFKDGKDAFNNYEGYGIVNDGGKREFKEDKFGNISAFTGVNSIVPIAKDDIIHKDLDSLSKAKGYDMDSIYQATILTSLANESKLSNAKLEKVFDENLKDLDKKITKGIQKGFANTSTHIHINNDNSHLFYKNDTL